MPQTYGHCPARSLTTHLWNPVRPFSAVDNGLQTGQGEEGGRVLLWEHGGIWRPSPWILTPLLTLSLPLGDSPPSLSEQWQGPLRAPQSP